MNTRKQSPLAYRVNDFCQAVGISRAKFYQELKSGNISIIKVGTRTLIPANAADEWLASKKQSNSNSNSLKGANHV